MPVDDCHGSSRGSRDVRVGLEGPRLRGLLAPVLFDEPGADAEQPGTGGVPGCVEVAAATEADEERLAQDVLRGVRADPAGGERPDYLRVSLEGSGEGGRDIDRPSDDFAVCAHVKYCRIGPIRFTMHRATDCGRPRGSIARRMRS